MSDASGNVISFDTAGVYKGTDPPPINTWDVKLIQSSCKCRRSINVKLALSGGIGDSIVGCEVMDWICNYIWEEWS